MNAFDDEKYMKIALEEAMIAAGLGEVPVGAVVVKIRPARSFPARTI